jgi:hypothetical protein
VIDSDVQTFKHKKMDILKLPIKRTYENIELDPALAASIVPTEVSLFIASCSALAASIVPTEVS